MDYFTRCLSLFIIDYLKSVPRGTLFFEAYSTHYISYFVRLVSIPKIMCKLLVEKL